jgi:hypothetical protein
LSDLFSLLAEAELISNRLEVLLEVEGALKVSMKGQVRRHGRQWRIVEYRFLVEWEACQET